MLYKADRFLEKIHPRGFAEVIAKVNGINLKVSLDFAQKKAIKLGFTVLGKGVSRKLPVLTRYGGQHFLLLKK
mgnify:CR=1 FL=1